MFGQVYASHFGNTSPPNHSITRRYKTGNKVKPIHMFWTFGGWQMVFCALGVDSPCFPGSNPLSGSFFSNGGYRPTLRPHSWFLRFFRFNQKVGENKRLVSSSALWMLDIHLMGSMSADRPEGAINSYAGVFHLCPLKRFFNCNKKEMIRRPFSEDVECVCVCVHACFCVHCYMHVPVCVSAKRVLNVSSYTPWVFIQGFLLGLERVEEDRLAGLQAPATHLSPPP